MVLLRGRHQGVEPRLLLPEVNTVVRNNYRGVLHPVIGVGIWGKREDKLGRTAILHQQGGMHRLPRAVIGWDIQTEELFQWEILQPAHGFSGYDLIIDPINHIQQGFLEEAQHFSHRRQL